MYMDKKNAEAKAESYRLCAMQIKSLAEGSRNRCGALANAAAVLRYSFPYYFWVGFYIVNGDSLELGPFQGPVACLSIKKGRGVCGTAWEKGETQIVPDVEKFPGHIACSSESRSEIVVPVFKDGEVKAVIDVDSSSPDSFDVADKEGLEKIAVILSFLF